MPLQQTSGNDTQDAYGGGAAAVPVYVESCFSTWLYTGTGSAQTITNGIDLSTKGGLVWVKQRSSNASIANNLLMDTVRGTSGGYLVTNNTNAAFSYAIINSFNTNGFGWNPPASVDSGYTYASWTFRKQPKFFDVVTYTGTGSATTIAHNLGSVPGCIIVKRTDTTGNWQVYHNGLTSAAYGIQLNLTNAQASDTTLWNSTAPTSTVFSLGTNADVNASGGTYVAYIYASNAGGFGLTGTDNVISCGSFTTNSSGNATVNLGWEPQWVLVKSTGIQNWILNDIMRGMSNTTYAELYPNLSTAESFGSGAEDIIPNATGFTINGTGSINASTTYIYIAIRRGPMAVPTDPTTVFAPVLSSSAFNTVNTTGFRIDNQFVGITTGDGTYSLVVDRLRGSSSVPSDTGYYPLLYTSQAFGESITSYKPSNNWSNTGFSIPNYSANTSTLYLNFQRAPKFFDEVCYTGTGSTKTINHNLNIPPELIIISPRSTSGNWSVYSAPTGNSYYLNFNNTNAISNLQNYWNNTTPTSSVFTLSSNANVNTSGTTYVAYLFATCSGVSKVGSYTGNGTTQTINCGFAGGARFVLIKRTDSTGNWYVYDTARGMTTLTDPYLLFNSGVTASTATLGSVTSVTTGFAVNAAVLAAINTSGATYLYLSIA